MYRHKKQSKIEREKKREIGRDTKTWSVLSKEREIGRETRN